MNETVYVPDDHPTPFTAYQAGAKRICVRTGYYDDTSAGEINLEREVTITSAGPGEYPIWKTQGIAGCEKAQVDHMCLHG